MTSPVFKSCCSFAAVALIVSVASATDWSGTISTDRTWTKAQSPHYITAGLIVNTNATVTIEAGSEVISRAGVTVYGRILANATQEFPIRFKLSHIVHIASPLSSEFQQVRVEGAYGAYFQSESPSGNHLFNHCLFITSPYSIYVVNSACRILNCTLNGIIGMQMTTESSMTAELTPMIYYNTFRYGGFSFDYPSGFDFQNRMFFRYNLVSAGTGVSITRDSYNVTIADCDLIRCSSSISLGAGVSSLTVTNCDLTNIVTSSGSTTWRLNNNWWGTNDFNTINQRIASGTLSDTTILPLATHSWFPQADIDNSDEGNKTTLQDAELVKKHLVGLVTLSPAQRVLADVDRNGVLDIRDALLIESYVNGLIWRLPNPSP